jgi:para-nitrobenzyl esterase
MRHTSVVEAPCGSLRGEIVDDLRVFRGVPYAEPPVGDLRWRPTRPHPGWHGVLDATEHGPICPQPADTPWDDVLGTRGRRTTLMDEDCLTLTISTPATEGEGRPVFVYIHGGGNIVGAGSWDVYSTAAISRTGGAVCVNVNYRLGPFGYMLDRDDPSGPRGNFWLDDLLCALRWVRQNIAAFDGDPGNVTIGGQSGGAYSALTLTSLADGESLFERAVLMGLPLGFPARTIEQYHPIIDRYLELLGADSVEGARRLPAQALLDPLFRLTQEIGSWQHWQPPFATVLDNRSLTSQPPDALAAGSGTTVDLLVGWAAEEYAIFAAPDRALHDVSEREVLERARVTFGDRAAEAYAEYAKARPGATPFDVLVDMLGDERYRMPAVDLLELRARQGRPAFAYQLEWQCDAYDGRLRAPHCLEIPFVLNNLDTWDDGQLIGGGPVAGRRPVVDAMHRAFVGFIADGEPAGETVPAWPRYDDRRTIMRFGQLTAPADSLLRHWRAVWERFDGTSR